ncbi:MAG: transposase [Flavobacteriales bacterium]
MAKRSRRTFSAEFKTKVVLEAIKERETIQALAQRFEVHPNQIVTWKKEFLENASNAFNGGNASNDDATRDKEKEKLLAKIGQLTVEVDFLKKTLS